MRREVGEGGGGEREGKGGWERGKGQEREREAKTKGKEKGRGERGGGGKERIWRKIRFSSRQSSVMCKVGGGRRRKTRGKKEE